MIFVLIDFCFLYNCVVVTSVPTVFLVEIEFVEVVGLKFFEVFGKVLFLHVEPCH